MKVADKTYYLNDDKTTAIPAKAAPKKLAEGEVFDETPDGAAYLLVREGQEVTNEMTEKYGVKGVEPKAEEPAEDSGADAEASDEADTAPAPKGSKKAAAKKK